MIFSDTLLIARINADVYVHEPHKQPLLLMDTA